MKYFKHMANASNDDFIEVIERQFGLDGYARWWKLLEAIAGSMSKHQNEPYASHDIRQWCAILKGKRKAVMKFLDFCVGRGKIDVNFFDPVSGTNADHSRNNLSLIPESNEFVLKITCPKMLDLRDEWTRRSVVAQEKLSIQAEADIECNIKPPLPPLKPPMGNLNPETLFQKLELKEVKNVNDFAAAAAACCRLLNKRTLSSVDDAVLAGWIERYDFSDDIVPFLLEKTEKFMEKNMGKRPGSLSYFSAGLRERYGK